MIGKFWQPWSYSTDQFIEPYLIIASEIIIFLETKKEI